MPTYLVIPALARVPRIVDAQLVTADTADQAATRSHRHCVVIEAQAFGQPPEPQQNAQEALTGALGEEARNQRGDA